MNQLISTTEVQTMSSREIASLTGKNHADICRDIRVMLCNLYGGKEEDYIRKADLLYHTNQGVMCFQYDKSNPNGWEYLLDKDHTVCLVSGYNAQMRMKIIKRWQELEEQRQPALPAPVETTLALVEATARMLNLCDSSKLQMLQQVFKEYNVPVGILPKYTTDGDASARLTKSLKDILKDNNVGISAQKANTYLVEEGILEVKTRQSSRGVKKFKALTELGLKFGKNEISPHNPREVQPHYYEDMAEELIKIIKSKHAIKQLTEVENE